MSSKAEYESRLERKLNSSINNETLGTPKKSELFDEKNHRSATATKENEKSRLKSPINSDATFSHSKSSRPRDDNNNNVGAKREQRVPLSPRNSCEDEKDARQTRKPKVMDEDEDLLSGFNRSRTNKKPDNESTRHSAISTKTDFGSLGRTDVREPRTRKLSDKDEPWVCSKTPDNKKSPNNSRSHSPNTPTERDYPTTKNNLSILKRQTSGGTKTPPPTTTTTSRNDEILKPFDGRKSPRRKSIERKKQLYEFGTSVDDDEDDDEDDVTDVRDGRSDKFNPIRRSRSFKDSNKPDDDEKLMGTRTLKKSDGIVTRDRYDDNVDFDMRRTTKSPVYFDELNSKLSQKNKERSAKEEEKEELMNGKGFDRQEERRKFSRSGSGNVNKRFDVDDEEDEIIRRKGEKREKSDEDDIRKDDPRKNDTSINDTRKDVTRKDYSRKGDAKKDDTRKDGPSSMKREKSIEGRKQAEEEDLSTRKDRERPSTAKREKSFEREGKNEKEGLSRPSSSKRDKSVERQKVVKEELKDIKKSSSMKREKSFERGRDEKEVGSRRDWPSSTKRENRLDKEVKDRDQKPPSSMKKEKSLERGRGDKKEKSFLDDELFGDSTTTSTPRTDREMMKELKKEKSIEKEERVKQRKSKEAGRGEELSFSELMAQRKKEREAKKSKTKETTASEPWSKSPNQRPSGQRRSIDDNDDSEEDDRTRTPKGSPKRKPLQRQIKVPDSSPESEKEEMKKGRGGERRRDEEEEDDEEDTRNVRRRKSTSEHLSASGSAKANEKERGPRRGRSNSVTDLKKSRRDEDEVDALSKRLNATTSFEDLTSEKSRQEKSNLSKQRSLSASNVRNPSSSPKRDKLSKSSSTKKLSENRKLSGTRVDTTYTVPTNSNDLKEIIYHQWLEKKKVQTKEEIKAKMLAQKRAAKQAEEEATERKVTAQKIYDAWNNSKTDQIQSEKGMKMKQKQAEKEKMEEALQKKKEAEKYFESWKREKDGKIKKIISQKKKEEKKKDKESFDVKRQTTEEALKAFESWKAQKARDLADQKKKEEEEKAKAGKEKLMAFEKKQEALRMYEQWKNVKKSPRGESPQLIQRSWTPAGRNLNNTIPDKVQPVIVRNRNVSR